jgi:hypothetical protein
MKYTGIISIILLAGCGGSSLSPYAGHWAGTYTTQFDETNVGPIEAKIGPDGSGIVYIDTVPHSMKAENGEVSGKVLGRVQVEDGRLAFRLQSGAPGVICGFMVRK